MAEICSLLTSRRRPILNATIALLLLGFVAATSHAENLLSVQLTPDGLPKDVIPRSYLVHLEPNVEKRVTDGVESIEVEVLKPTTRIVLNALETEITKAKIETGGRPEEITPQFDLNRQTVSFDLKDELQPGKYTLSIKFQSRIIEQPHGLFIQRYENSVYGSAEDLLATAGTRQIFPCWDEPAFRAAFQLSVKTGRQDTVISSTPIYVEQPLGPDQKIVVFEKTPLIPSNMVFLVCGRFEWLEDEVAGVKLRIFTMPGKKELGKYALEVTKQLLPYFNNYFAIPLPLSKLDQIAFPSDACDDTENWGGIVYDEDTLLCDPQTSYDSTRQKVFLAIAHRIAQQWCGGLGTTASRNDLWLNEGLASWIAKKAANHFDPQWKIWLHAAVEKAAVMTFDAGESTHAIQRPGTGQEQPTHALDLITMQKPWLLLRMLENFSGEDPFREGVRAYLAAHRGSDTTSEDLWAALEHATGKPIVKFMVGWAEQPGFPLIKITTQCVNGNRVISLEQVPFVVGQGSPTPMQWSVPVGIRSTLSSNEVKYALLDKLSNNFDLAGCSGVIQANAGGVGYFRMLYEPALFNDLQKNVEKLPESDRLNLVADTWALVESGNLPASSYFELLEDLNRDNSFAVWQSALGTGETIGALRLIDRLEHGRPGREAYQKYICSLFGPKFQELGWDERAGEDAEIWDYRAMLIETLGFFGNRDVIDESFKRFENYRENPSSLAPNLRSAVIAIVGRYSSQTVSRELLSMAAKTLSIDDKRMYLRALGAALDPEIARDTLQYLLSDQVKPGDASLALEYFAAEGEHPDIAWSFAVAHWQEMQERFGLLRQTQVLSSIARAFTDDQRADEISAFAQANLPPPALRQVENAVHEIRFNAKLKAKTLPAIEDWIKAKLEGNTNSAVRNH
jgi:aminopeptidase N